MISWALELNRMPQNPISDRSALVQVMAWCPQATSHYLSQCWPRSVSQYGVTKLQWLKEMGQSWAFWQSSWECMEGMDTIMVGWCLRSDSHIAFSHQRGESHCLVETYFFAYSSVLFLHDDVITWKHFPRYWSFVQGLHGSPVNSPHKGQWHRALMVSLICTWIKGWEKNLEAGDLRCHHTHYDITIMNMKKRISCSGRMALRFFIKEEISASLIFSNNSKTGLEENYLSTAHDCHIRYVYHYSDVIMSSMSSQITSVLIVCSTVCSGTDQENIKTSRDWPLWWESAVDWWIPHTVTWKGFHLMMLSCTFCALFFVVRYTIHVISCNSFTISFRVSSLVMWKPYNCPSASEETLKDMGKFDQYLTSTKHS